jgi:hypothetical protein
MAGPSPSPVSLDKDVYFADFEFRDTLRQTLDNIDSESSMNIIEGAIRPTIDVVGRDPVKLFGLIDVVHGKIPKNWNWATGAAVSFYRYDRPPFCNQFSGMDFPVFPLRPLTYPSSSTIVSSTAREPVSN